LGWHDWQRVVLVGALATAACGDDGPATDGLTTGGPATDGTASAGGDDRGGSGPGEYCPGTMPWADPICRVDDDCPEFQTCVSSPASANPGGCGGATGCSGPFEGEECFEDDECAVFPELGPDPVCLHAEDPCCGPVSTCVAACTADSCAPDQVCGPDRLCVAAACDEGYACPAGRRCEVGAAGSDDHGCVVIPCDEAGADPCPEVHACVDGTCQRIPCATDDDCPCGTCNDALCWDRPWVCFEGPA
jgi:hypothetical protein